MGCLGRPSLALQDGQGIRNMIQMVVRPHGYWTGLAHAGCMCLECTTLTMCSRQYTRRAGHAQDRTRPTSYIVSRNIRIIRGNKEDEKLLLMIELSC